MSTPTLTAPTNSKPSASQSTSQTASQTSDDPDLVQAAQNQKVVAWAKKAFGDIKASRVNVERQWYLNISFVYGRQNVQFASSANSINGYRLSVPPAPPWRVRLVINRIRSIVRKEIAKVVSQKPRFNTVPATTEDEDIAAARAADQIFDSLYSGKKVQSINRRAEWWTTVCGTGFIKCYWNQGAYDNDSKQQGDICIEEISPFHVFVPDQRVVDIEQQPYVIHASTRSIEQTVSMYPELKGKITADTAASNDLLSDAFLNILGQQPGDNQQCLWLEVWIKPGGHPMFPKGGMLTIIGDNLVQAKAEYPYAHGLFPFIKLENVHSGKFYSESIVTDLIALQREYNRSRSQLIENRNLMGKPKLMAIQGSVDPRKISSEPGQVILVKPGFGQFPTSLPMPAMPQYVMDQITMLQSDMDDISGQHDISRGENPSQVTATSALAYLQEQDDSMLSDTIESLEEGMEKLGRICLGYVSQFWTTERTVKVVGSDQAFDALMLKGDILKGNTDIRVEAGSALPTSKAARQAFVMDLIKLGAIQVQDGLEVLEIGGINKIYDDYLVDIHQAQRENLKMQNQMPLLQGVTAGGENSPNTWDNHAAHIATHNKFRKQQTFEALSPEIKTIFEQHVQLHMQELNSTPPTPPTDPNQTQLPPQQVGTPPPPPPMPPAPSGGPPGLPGAPVLPNMPSMIQGQGPTQ